MPTLRESTPHDLSLVELRRLLTGRQRSVDRLQQRREELLRELDALEVEAAEAVLRLVLLRVLGPMRLPEIVDAAEPFANASPSLRSPAAVRHRLGAMRDVHKVDRGLYQLVDWDETFDSWGARGH